MTGLRALLKRILYTLPALWLIVSIVFLLLHLVPGDPVQQMLGEGATASDLAALRHQYGLDAPLKSQYIHYWRGVLHGDLGRSLRLNDSVAHLVLSRYPYTLELTAAALLVALALALPGGVAAALRRRRFCAGSAQGPRRKPSDGVAGWMGRLLRGRQTAGRGGG